jgi:hypothetical protein
MKTEFSEGLRIGRIALGHTHFRSYTSNSLLYPRVLVAGDFVLEFASLS